jgi:hypothetical protein
MTADAIAAVVTLDLTAHRDWAAWWRLVRTTKEGKPRHLWIPDTGSINAVHNH